MQGLKQQQLMERHWYKKGIQTSELKDYFKVLVGG